MDNVSEQKNCDNFDVFLLRKRHKKFQVSKIWKWSFQHENKLLLSYPCSKHANEILRSLTATTLKVKNLYTCTMKKKYFCTLWMCVFHFSSWHSHSLFFPRREMTCFAVVWTTRALSDNFQFFLLNPLTAEWALRALIDFTLSNARRFYSSMGNPLDGKGLTTSKTMYPLNPPLLNSSKTELF